MKLAHTMRAGQMCTKPKQLVLWNKKWRGVKDEKMGFRVFCFEFYSFSL